MYVFLNGNQNQTGLKRRSTSDEVSANSFSSAATVNIWVTKCHLGLQALLVAASNCLSAHLTADCSDDVCCQSLLQRVLCQITRLFFSLSYLRLTRCSTRASLQRCTSFGHLQRMRPPCAKWGPPWFVGPYAQRVLCVYGGAALGVNNLL